MLWTYAAFWNLELLHVYFWYFWCYEYNLFVFHLLPYLYKWWVNLNFGNTLESRGSICVNLNCFVNDHKLFICALNSSPGMCFCWFLKFLIRLPDFCLYNKILSIAKILECVLPNALSSFSLHFGLIFSNYDDKYIPFLSLFLAILLLHKLFYSLRYPGIQI